MLVKYLYTVMFMNLKENNLKQFGLKITKPRLKILYIFENSKKRHLSAEDLYKILRQKNEEIGMATIYRVLSQFQSAGIIQRLHLGREQALYELESHDNHDHMICIKCNKVEEFTDKVIENRKKQAVTNKKGKLIGHSSVIYIECEKCINKKNTEIIN